MPHAQVGAASLDDGQIELMVHRRLVDDDNCGLAQELDETEIVDFHGARHGAGLITRGTNRLTLEPRKSAHRVWRPLADRAYARPLVAFARATRQEEVRFRDSRERGIAELLHPDPAEELRPRDLARFVGEARQRLSAPLTALTFALVGMAVALTGQFRRQGGGLRLALGVGLVVGLLAV